MNDRPSLSIFTIEVDGKRRKLMDAWSAYCEPKTSANIVQLRNFLGETVN
jgi:hypothetical protein